jgi:hypothetical protein
VITIDKYNNISITQHDNAILNFKVTNRFLTDGDEVLFLAKFDYDQDYYDIEIHVTTFKEDGSASIFISENDTKIEGGIYKYSICVHTYDGAISTLITGDLEILEGVHHGE